MWNSDHSEILNFVQKKKWPGFKLLLSILLFVFTFLLGIITTGNQFERSEFAYIFTTAFSAYYLCSFFRNTKRINTAFCTAAAIIIPIIYIQPLTRFLYTDSDTMREDKEWMSQVYFQAMQKGAKEGDALCVIGYLHSSEKRNGSFALMVRRSALAERSISRLVYGEDTPGKLLDGWALPSVTLSGMMCCQRLFSSTIAFGSTEGWVPSVKMILEYRSFVPFKC